MEELLHSIVNTKFNDFLRSHWKQRFWVSMFIILWIPMFGMAQHADLNRYINNLKQVNQNLLKVSGGQTNIYYVDSAYSYVFLSPTDSMVGIKYYYYYNGNNVVDSSHFEEFDPLTSSWMVFDKTDYTLNKAGKDSFLITNVLNIISGTYSPELKTVYYYNQAGNDTLAVSYDYISNAWTNFEETSYKYDSEGYDTLSIQKNWETNTYVTHSTSRSVYTFNSGGYPTLITTDTLNGKTKAYDPNVQSSLSYNSNGSNNITSIYRWDDTTSVWKIEGRLYSYYKSMEVSSSLAAAPSTLTVNAAASSHTSFTITSNVSWTVSSKYTWLTPNVTSGSNNGTITLTATENPYGTTRVDTITVSSTGLTSQKVIVTQAAGAAALSVSERTANIGAAAASTTTFTITSNISWTVTTGKQTWLAPTPASGSDTATITLTAAVNPKNSSRMDSIFVSGTGVKTDTILVTQAAGTYTGVITLPASDVTLYPIPVTNYLYISVPDLPANARVAIHDINGVEVYESAITDELTTLDLSKYSQGMYVVTISTNQGILVTKKIVKQ